MLQNTFVGSCIACPFLVPSATQFAHDCMAAKNIDGNLLAMNFATQSTATLRLSKCHKSSKQHHIFSASLKIREKTTSLLKDLVVMDKMASTILVAIAGFCICLEVCHGAIDSSVKVFGTTVGPNFKREEGIRRLILKYDKPTTNLT